MLGAPSRARAFCSMVALSKWATALGSAAAYSKAHEQEHTSGCKSALSTLHPINVVRRARARRAARSAQRAAPTHLWKPFFLAPGCSAW